MKKIVFITKQLKKFGGIERFITTLANGLSKNYEVTIVANYGKEVEKLAFKLGSRVRVVFLSPATPEEVSLKQILVSFKFWKILPELRRRFDINSERKWVFKKYLSVLDTDVIITDRALHSFLVKKYYRGRARLIATDHNYHQNQKRYVRKLEKSVTSFDYLVVPSKELQRFYADLVRPVKCLAIPNPLNNIPSKKTSFSKKNLIAVGRFVPEKDFLTLIDVVARVVKKLPDTKLYLIGDGPQKDDIKNKIKIYNLGKHVILTGKLKSTEIEKYYYKSSLYIMTSITEAFPLVLIEAMSYGLPVVAFDRASGVREQVTNRVGVLVENGDVNKMAEEIVYLLSNGWRLQELQSAINLDVQKYNVKNVIQKWNKVL